MRRMEATVKTLTTAIITLVLFGAFVSWAVIDVGCATIGWECVADQSEP